MFSDDCLSKRRPISGADLGILRGGGGFWAGILQGGGGGGGGLGSRSAGIFVYMYWQAKKKNLWGVNPPPPPLDPPLDIHSTVNIHVFPIYGHIFHILHSRKYINRTIPRIPAMQTCTRNSTIPRRTTLRIRQVEPRRHQELYHTHCPCMYNKMTLFRCLFLSSLDRHLP